VEWDDDIFKNKLKKNPAQREREREREREALADLLTEPKLTADG